VDITVKFKKQSETEAPDKLPTHNINAAGVKKK
jgi:hypothetical protein